MKNIINRISIILESNYPFILVCLGPLVLFGSLLTHGNVIFWGTSYLQFLPWRLAGWESIINGSLPVWNHYNGYGAPLLANYQSAFYYPPNLLLYLFALISPLSGIAIAQTVLVILHISLAGWGMVFLTRELGYGKSGQTIAALSFSLSGYLISRASFLSMNAALAWLPWILFLYFKIAFIPDFRAAFRSKYFFLAIISTSFLLLAGHAQLAWYTLLLAFFWFMTWSWISHKTVKCVAGKLALFLTIGILSIGVASIQLLPTTEFLLLSQRSSNVEYSYALNFSLWPWRFLTLLSSNLFGNPANGNYWVTADNYWEDNIYVGISAFLFAVVAMKRLITGQYTNTSIRRPLSIFVIVMMILSVIFALGRYTPIFPFLYKNVPSFNMFQAPTRFSIWLVIGLSILSGLGIENWKKPIGKTLYWTRLFTAGAVGIFVTSIVIRKISNGIFQETYITGIGETGFFLSLVMLVYLFSSGPSDQNTGKTSLRGILILIVIFGEMVYMNWGANPGLSIRDLGKINTPKGLSIPIETQTQVFLTKEAEDVVKFKKFFQAESYSPENGWSDIREYFIPNSNIIDGFSAVNNFDPLVTERYQQFMNIVAPQFQSRSELNNSFWAIESVIDSDEPSLEKLMHSRDDNYRLRWFTCALSSLNMEDSVGQFQKVLATGDLDNTLIVESRGYVDYPCSPALGAMKIIDYKSIQHSSKFIIETPSDGWIMQLNANYPGWKAKLDGKQVPVHFGDVMFRAIFVPAGIHDIEIYFNSGSTIWGIAISMITISGLIIFTIFLRLEKRN